MTDKAPEIKKWNVLATAFWMSFSIVWVVIAIYAATRPEPQPAIPLDPCLSCHVSYDDVFQLVRAENEERYKSLEEVMTATDNELINAVNKYHGDKYNTWEE